MPHIEKRQCSRVNIYALTESFSRIIVHQKKRIIVSKMSRMSSLQDTIVFYKIQFLLISVTTSPPPLHLSTPSTQHHHVKKVTTMRPRKEADMFN